LSPKHRRDVLERWRLEEKAKVHVIIETKTPQAPATRDGDDPTGWKAIDALRGIVKG
jgi:hypothetical protein